MILEILYDPRNFAHAVLYGAYGDGVFTSSFVRCRFVGAPSQQQVRSQGVTE